MDSEKQVKHLEHMVSKLSGSAVRPYREDGAEFREDGYVNMLNKYGTQKDVSEHYYFAPEMPVPDVVLATNYESNGLFAKIIDTPAEEAVKHGFELEGLSNDDIESFLFDSLDELDWEEIATTCIKWARLFGGSMAVMLIDDGRGLEEPLDWNNIKSIDDIRIYDRSRIQPDYGTIFKYDPHDPYRTRGSRLGMPEYYQVFSYGGNFIVHDSRCLTFQNGVLPEITTNSLYRIWGVPEYLRISKAVRDAEVAHGSATKLLDRSVQAIYKMRDLSAEMATEEGEDRVIRRLQAIDMAKGLLNTIAIDGDGEEYDFRTFQFSGVSNVIDSTCNFLSAVTSIPQTILFGRSPSGMNATGHSDFENYYNYVERIQKRMLRKNLRYLLTIIAKAGVKSGEIKEIPNINIKFKPLWNLDETEEVALEQQKAQVQLTRAQVAQAYVSMQAIDPQEVRKSLADSKEFDVETMLDDYTEEELEEFEPQQQGGEQGGMGGMMAALGGENGMPAGGPQKPQDEADAETQVTGPEEKKPLRTSVEGQKVELQELEQAHEIDKKLEAESMTEEENEDSYDNPEPDGESSKTRRQSRVMDVSNHTGTDFETAGKMLNALEDYLGENTDGIMSVQEGMGVSEYEQKYGTDYDKAENDAELIEDFIAHSVKWSYGNLFRVMTVSREESDSLINSCEKGNKFAFGSTTLWTTRSGIQKKDVKQMMEYGQPIVFKWKNAKSAAPISYLLDNCADKSLASKDTRFVADKIYTSDDVVFIECREAG